MDCFTSKDNIYQDPQDCNQYTIEFERKKKEHKIIDVKKIIESISPDIASDVSVIIEVFSQETFELNPCQKKEVATGLLLKTFIPISHSIFFEGYINNLGIKTNNKCVVPIFENELKISIANFSPKICEIPLNMPLGKLIIKQNL